MKIKKFNESSDFKVFIEKVASSSDFGKYIDLNKDELGFGSDEFFDNMELFEEGSLSSRFDIDWCEKLYLVKQVAIGKIKKSITLLFLNSWKNIIQKQ